AIERGHLAQVVVVIAAGIQKEEMMGRFEWFDAVRQILCAKGAVDILSRWPEIVLWQEYLAIFGDLQPVATEKEKRAALGCTLVIQSLHGRVPCTDGVLTMLQGGGEAMFA